MACRRVEVAAGRLEGGEVEVRDRDAVVVPELLLQPEGLDRDASRLVDVSQPQVRRGEIAEDCAVPVPVVGLLELAARRS